MTSRASREPAESLGVLRRSKSTHQVGMGGILARVFCLGLPGVLTGCGSDDGRVATYPVSGKVTVNNEVPAGALVVLYPVQGGKDAELRPSGRVGSDGSFRLTTYDGEDGAPAGEYRATIQWHKIIKKGADYAAGPNVVPPAYASPERSPWRITVRDASNELDLVAVKR